MLKKMTNLLFEHNSIMLKNEELNGYFSLYLSNKGCNHVILY